LEQIKQYFTGDQNIETLYNPLDKLFQSQYGNLYIMWMSNKENQDKFWRKLYLIMESVFSSNYNKFHKMSPNQIINNLNQLTFDKFKDIMKQEMIKIQQQQQPEVVKNRAPTKQQSGVSKPLGGRAPTSNTNKNNYLQEIEDINNDFDYDTYNSYPQELTENATSQLRPTEIVKQTEKNKHIENKEPSVSEISYLISNNDLRKEDDYLVFDMSLKNIINFKLNWFKCNFSFNNINNFNNKLNISVDSSDSFDITIPVGNYSRESLIKSLNQLLMEKNTNFKIELVPFQNKTRIYTTNSKKIKLTFPNSKLNVVLGFSKLEYTNGTQYISDGVPSLEYSNLLIVSENEAFNYTKCKSFDFIEFVDLSSKIINKDFMNKFDNQGLILKDPITIDKFKFKLVYYLENEIMSSTSSTKTIIPDSFYLHLTFKVTE
jgi:hypothetical protein